MSELLFQEFEEVSAKQWKQKIQFDLKGGDYNEELIYKSRDGVNIKPFYNTEDVKSTAKVPSPTNWEICEKIYVASVEISNYRAKEVLKKGAESLWFIIPSEETDLQQLLKGLQHENVSIYISLQFLSDTYLNKINKITSGFSSPIYLQIDIIGNLARSGNWFSGYKEDFEILSRFHSTAGKEVFKSIVCIDSTLYQNAGAAIPQELAYSLAHANEYINHFSQSKAALTGFKPQFLISTGANYFFEIAKIRALRLLYATIAQVYNANEECHILAQPTKRDKTLYDYNVNLLRTTTQSMSAVLGGANAVNNMPYDAIYHKNNEFGDRISRNQLLILKTESYLDKVSNAAEGAYYIENLTSQFAEKALEIFKDIEKGGGFVQQLKEGVIQRKIAESAEEEQQKFDSGELVLIGTNKYANPGDRMKGELELFPFLKQNKRKTLIQPILEKRLAEKYEQERLEKEEQTPSL